MQGKPQKRSRSENRQKPVFRSCFSSLVYALFFEVIKSVCNANSAGVNTGARLAFKVAPL